MKEWQKGIPLDRLKHHAGIYKHYMKEFCHGAFGLPKERDIANAIVSKQWFDKLDDKGEASAIMNRLSRDSIHRDFAGRELKLRAGDVLVKAFAGTANQTIHLMFECIIEQHARSPVWVQAHMDNKSACSILRDLGFEWKATKVMASSDLIGMWFRPGIGDRNSRLHELTTPEDQIAIDILKREFLSPAEHILIMDELTAWMNVRPQEGMAQHYSSYNKRHSWKALALRGYTDDPFFIQKPAEMSKQWKQEHRSLLKALPRWTEAKQDFPSTIGIIQSRFPGVRLDRVRFMSLDREGGELTRHADITDRDAGTKNGTVARLHIPILSSPEVIFTAWDEQGEAHSYHMPERSLCYLDVRKPHAARNDGPHERVHLVVDVFCDERIRAWLRGDA